MRAAVQTVWITSGDTTGQCFDLFPLKNGDNGAQPSFLITNELPLPEVLEDAKAIFKWNVILFADLFSIAFPTSAAETIIAMLSAAGGEPKPDTNGCAAPVTEYGQQLWQAWQNIEVRLSALPMWALESISISLSEAGARELSRLFECFAEKVRQTGGDCKAWHHSFPMESIAAAPQYRPMHSDCSMLDASIVAAPLLSNGMLADSMPGYEPRLGQIAMLKEVVQAFNHGHHLMVEAGTGVGKSLAYLLPAAHWAMLNDLNVVVSTSTRNLQSQLMFKDIPLVKQTLESGTGQTLRAALLKGRSNYLCLRRFGQLLDQARYELERPLLRQFARTIAWAATTDDGDLEMFNSSGGLDATFVASLASTVEECAGTACRFFRRCFLRKARERARKAHIVVANHSLVFADMNMEKAALPPHDQLIFDEAHNIEDVATRHFSVEVSNNRLNTILRRLIYKRGKHASGILEVLTRLLNQGMLMTSERDRKSVKRLIRELPLTLDDLQECGKSFFKSLYAVLGKKVESRRFRRPDEDENMPDGNCAPWISHGGSNFSPWSEELGRDDFLAARDLFRQALNKAIAEIKVIVSLMEEARPADELGLYDDQSGELAGAAEMLKGLLADFDFVVSGNDFEYVFWVQRSYSSGHNRLAEMCAAPLNIGPRLAESVYENKTSVIFCSATLRIGSSFNYVARRLGIDLLEVGRCKTYVAESPFDFQRQVAVLVASFLPEPSVTTERNYTEQLSALLHELFVATHGRALGLFTSYEMLHQCADMLRLPLKQAGLRLLVQGEDGSRDQITNIFRAGGGTVLLGTHSFWEGVDVTGDALSCVVLARLPFSAVNDPLVDARCDDISRNGGNPFKEYAVPAAVIRFRQGFGRLIRHRNDRGVVIVADPRIVTKKYGHWFRSSLPCAAHVAETPAILLQRVAEMLSYSNYE